MNEIYRGWRNKIILSIGIVLLIILIGILLKDITLPDSYSSVERFVKIYREGSFTIYYDKKTNVEYVMINNGHGGTALTTLVDNSGKPLLYKNN